MLQFTQTLPSHSINLVTTCILSEDMAIKTVRFTCFSQSIACLMVNLQYWSKYLSDTVLYDEYWTLGTKESDCSGCPTQQTWYVFGTGKGLLRYPHSGVHISSVYLADGS